MRSMMRLSKVARGSAFRMMSISRPVAAGMSISRTPVMPMRQHKMQHIRMASTGAGLSESVIYDRIVEVLSTFERIDTTKLSMNADFSKDLGLDSLDTVEVVMAIEEEFGIEIPDEEADAIKSVQDAVKYVVHTPSAV